MLQNFGTALSREQMKMVVGGVEEGGAVCNTACTGTQASNWQGGSCSSSTIPGGGAYHLLQLVHVVLVVVLVVPHKSRWSQLNKIMKTGFILVKTSFYNYLKQIFIIKTEKN